MTVPIDWAPQFAGDPAILKLLRPAKLHTVDEAIGHGGAAPRRAGIYGWYFDAPLPGIDSLGCHRRGAWTLLYVGISPNKPPTNGRAPSRSHVHLRLRSHFRGNAAGSTLRLTLGCLLEREIGTALRRVGGGGTLTFTNPGEQLLDRWLHAHGRVAWADHSEPWLVEDRLLASGLPLPLKHRRQSVRGCGGVVDGGASCRAAERNEPSGGPATVVARDAKSLPVASPTLQPNGRLRGAGKGTSAAACTFTQMLSS